jgi:hypothetical protein
MELLPKELVYKIFELADFGARFEMRIRTKCHSRYKSNYWDRFEHGPFLGCELGDNVYVFEGLRATSTYETNHREWSDLFDDEPPSDSDELDEEARYYRLCDIGVLANGPGEDILFSDGLHRGVYVSTNTFWGCFESPHPNFVNVGEFQERRFVKRWALSSAIDVRINKQSVQRLDRLTEFVFEPGEDAEHYKITICHL